MTSCLTNRKIYFSAVVSKMHRKKKKKKQKESKRKEQRDCSGSS